MKKKQKGIGIQLALFIFGLAPFFLVVVITTVINILNISEQIKDGEFETLRAASESVNQYFAYDIINNGKVDYDEYSDHEFMECLKDDDIELTLIKDDKRFLTSLKNDEGKYNEGTAIDAEIYKTLKSGKDYSAEHIKIGGEEYFVYYEPIYDGDGNFWGAAFAGAPEADVNNAINSLIISTLIVTGIIAIIVTIVIVILARIIYKSLAVAADSLDVLSTGNLKNEIKGKSKIKEINSILASTKSLHEQLCSSVGGAKLTAINLGTSVGKVDDSSNKSADGTNQIAQAVTELATTAQSMAMTVQDANISVMEMGEAISSITNKANESADAANNMKKISQHAVEIMNKVETSNDNSVKAINEIGILTQACSDAVSQIKKAAEVISEIAEQTNLLALNASIEAARAGESGKGFAVVADSIKTLAGQSGESATEISEFVVDIVDKVERCVVASKNAEVVMLDQNNLVIDATKNIESLSLTVVDVAKNVDDISNNAKILDSAKDSVLNSISDLSAISEENAASSEEVTASVENIAMAVSLAKDESNAMKVLANELDDKMKFFDI